MEILQTRFWCRNLCPSGAGFALLDRLRLRLRRRMRPANLDSTGGISRRGLLLAGLGGAALPLLPGVRPGPAPTRLRPPGVGTHEAAFLTACIRCGACVRACPTHGLQPMLLADGLTGVFAPRLVPRLGACEHGCQACAQVCPTGAIPLTDLATKQQQRIGRAVHDRKRCLPWSGGGECRVCWEHCPVADKAITLRMAHAPNGQAIPLPDVDAQRCIGCGTCEFVCPIEGQAGIRVSGNLNISALHVVNTSNISVSGASVGVPTVVAPSLGGLAGAAASATAAGSNAAGETIGKQERAAAPLGDLPSMITVEVLGYGGGDS